MGLRAALEQRFDIASNLKLPVLFIDGLALHFRLPTAQDARRGAREAQMLAVSLPEIQAAAVELGILACIEWVQDVDGEGNPTGKKSRLWQDDMLTEVQKQSLAKEIAEAEANGGLPGEDLHWRAVINLHALLLDTPGNALDEIVEFFTSRIRNIGDASDLAIYTCENPKCFESDMTRPPREAGYHCTGCGNKLTLFRTIRHGAKSPFRSA